MKNCYWIWYYGDYEIEHMTKLHMRREQRGAFMPSMWHLYSPYVSVFFEKKLTCEAGTLTAYALGEAYIAVDGKRHPMGKPVVIPAGTHTVTAAVSTGSFNSPTKYVATPAPLAGNPALTHGKRRPTSSPLPTKTKSPCPLPPQITACSTISARRPSVF